MSINKLLIDDQPHQVLPALAKAIGLNEAIFLQQLHYLLNYSKNEFEGKPWIFNSLEQWEEIFCYWSLSTIRRTIKSLNKQGLLLTTDKFNKYKFDKTKWYSIDYDRLANLSVSSVKNNRPFVQNEQITSVQNEQANNQENNKNKYITPLPPKGESPNGDNFSQEEFFDEQDKSFLKNQNPDSEYQAECFEDEDLINPDNAQRAADMPPAKSKNRIDYQVFLDCYNELNELNGDRLPEVRILNQNRKRKIKRFLGILKYPTLEAFRNYLMRFYELAKPFYFGENNRGWRADFDYLLQEKTYVKVREESL